MKTPPLQVMTLTESEQLALARCAAAHFRVGMKARGDFLQRAGICKNLDRETYDDAFAIYRRWLVDGKIGQEALPL